MFGNMLNGAVEYLQEVRQLVRSTVISRLWQRSAQVSCREMVELPENLFANPAWHALQLIHRHLAAFAGDACRYRAEVSPFAAVATPSVKVMQDLRTLLVPGEAVWLVGEQYPPVPELRFEGT